MWAGKSPEQLPGGVGAGSSCVTLRPFLVQIQAGGHSVQWLVHNGLSSALSVIVGSDLGVGICSKKISDQGRCTL